MAALDDVMLTKNEATLISQYAQGAGPLGPAVKAVLAQVFWRWFELHRDQKVTSIKWLFVRKTFYLKDFLAVFELVFGSEPRLT